MVEGAVSIECQRCGKSGVVYDWLFSNSSIEISKVPFPTSKVLFAFAIQFESDWLGRLTYLCEPPFFLGGVLPLGNDYWMSSFSHHTDRYWIGMILFW